MTKPQIWVAAFLALFLFLFILSRVTDNSDLFNKNKPGGTSMMGQSQQSGEHLSPAEMISSLGCVNCHGADLSGTNKGPALVKLQDNWSRQELINYLRNPESYMDSGRFKEFKLKYPGVMMPSFGNIDIKDLGKMADYLLER